MIASPHHLSLKEEPKDLPKVEPEEDKFEKLNPSDKLSRSKAIEPVMKKDIVKDGEKMMEKIEEEPKEEEKEGKKKEKNKFKNIMLIYLTLT